jgi:deoxycytidylate deaminase
MASMRFTGSYPELQERLAALSGEGEWHDLNKNQKQFRHRDGGILNWYPSTGTINFQGPTDGKSKLESVARSVLSVPDSIAGSPPMPMSQGISDLERLPVEDIVVRERKPPPPTGPAAQVGMRFLGQKFSESELVFGLVGAVGTELKLVVNVLMDRLTAFNYEAVQVRVSTEIIPEVVDLESVVCSATSGSSEYLRISKLMDAGNAARQQSCDNSVLALGVAAKISADRPKGTDSQREPFPRRAYIIHSLKHPEEVARLREIYPEGFYLVGVHADEKRRHDHLVHSKRMTLEEAEALMRRDEDEQLPHGQRTSDTFHLSDLFVRIDENQDKLRNSIWRLLDVLFGHPYVTPIFDEYAMFMAFSAALRSADLSRQVGAVVARNKEIIATGANECPKYGGGLYWPEYDKETHQIKDAKGGRDYTRGEDANKVEQQRIIEDILNRVDANVADRDALRKALQESRLADITEYGRMVHAEMEALLSIARSNVSAVGATLYATTFPCHNCAKHIVAAGINRVVFIEPYPKSKAAQLHSDSITLGFSEDEKTVHFEPFVGVGPRRFFDLFSMRHGSGYLLKRKNSEGQVVEWKPEESKLRIQMLPCSYIELELIASSMFNQFRKRKQGTSNG